MFGTSCLGPPFGTMGVWDHVCLAPTIWHHGQLCGTSCLTMGVWDRDWDEVFGPPFGTMGVWDQLFGYHRLARWHHLDPSFGEHIV